MEMAAGVATCVCVVWFAASEPIQHTRVHSPPITTNGGSSALRWPSCFVGALAFFALSCCVEVALFAVMTTPAFFRRLALGRHVRGRVLLCAGQRPRSACSTNVWFTAASGAAKPLLRIRVCCVVPALAAVPSLCVKYPAASMAVPLVCACCRWPLITGGAWHMGHSQRCLYVAWFPVPAL